MMKPIYIGATDFDDRIRRHTGFNSNLILHTLTLIYPVYIMDLG